MPVKPLSMLSPAATDLGLGLGDALSEQVAGETEEMRKKRQRQQSGLSGVGDSPATLALFGGMGALGA